MTKEDSKLMQGVAILIMIFFHQFGSYSGSDTLRHLALANNPVPLYTLLSGYGFYKVHMRGHDRHYATRCLRLYLVMWITLTVFITAESIFCDYPKLTALQLFMNYTGVQSYIYIPAWFVLPYCLLALAYPVLMRWAARRPWYEWLGISYAIYLIMTQLTHLMLFQQNYFQEFYLLFSYMLGAAMAKYDVVEKFRERLDNKTVLLWLLLAGIITIRYFVSTGAVIAFYYAAITILVTTMHKNAVIKKALTELGTMCVWMWMIHGWINTFFMFETDMPFKPLIEFILVTAVSWILARIFSFATRPLFKFFK